MDDSPREPRTPNAARKNIGWVFARWLVFGFMGSAVPLVIVALLAYTKGVPPHLEEGAPNPLEGIGVWEYVLVVVTARGELFLLTAVLGLAAVGELTAAADLHTGWGTFWLGICGILAVLGAALYGIVSVSYEEMLSVREDSVRELASVIASGELSRTGGVAIVLYVGTVVANVGVIIYTIRSNRPRGDT